MDLYASQQTGNEYYTTPSWSGWLQEENVVGNSMDSYVPVFVQFLSCPENLFLRFRCVRPHPFPQVLILVFPENHLLLHPLLIAQI